MLRTHEIHGSVPLCSRWVRFFFAHKEGLWEEYPPLVHGRRHPVDRQGRPVDIGILPVNGQPEHVDMDIDPVNKEVCPVNMESCGIQAEWECPQAISICLHVLDMPIIPVYRRCTVCEHTFPQGQSFLNTTVACKQAKTSC